MVGLILNAPWTLVGLVGALLSVPVRVSFNYKPRAIIFYSRSFWWFPVPRAKGITFANCVLIRMGTDAKILTHELIHVRQAEEHPFTQHIFYIFELLRHGYWKNRYEVEAYNESDTWPPDRGPSKV